MPLLFIRNALFLFPAALMCLVITGRFYLFLLRHQKYMVCVCRPFGEANVQEPHRREVSVSASEYQTIWTTLFVKMNNGRVDLIWGRKTNVIKGFHVNWVKMRARINNHLSTHYNFGSYILSPRAYSCGTFFIATCCQRQILYGSLPRTRNASIYSCRRLISDQVGQLRSMRFC